MNAIAQTGNTFVDGTFVTIEDADHHLQQLHYIRGGDGLFAIYTLDEKGDGAMYYIHKDYQGSFETITNNQGTVVEKLSYDPPLPPVCNWWYSSHFVSCLCLMTA